MADQIKDSSKSKSDPKKKEATVLLTPEELRAIAGGTQVLKTTPVVGPDIVSGRKH